MASYNGHVTDRDSQAVERGGEESDPRPQPMPAPVEALILFGYPPDLVLSAYRQLQSARATDSRHTTSVPGSGNAAMTGNGLPRAVSAASLLAAVDDTVGDPDVSSSGAIGAGSGAATSSGSSGSVGAVQGVRGEEGVTTSGEVGRDQTAEDVPFTAHGSSGPGQQQSVSCSTPDSIPSSNTSFINNESSANNQSSKNDQSSIVNAEEAVSSTETSSCPLASPAVQKTPETASSWTSSRTAEGLADSSPVTTFSSLTTTSSVTASSHVETSVAERSAGTAADPRQNTPTAPSPSSGSSVVSRDRSRDREDQNEAEAAEEKVRERRRQLSRLRALRAENRRLKERQTCRHCGQKPVALTLLPCGHFCLCEDCGPSFDECPVCRKTILADIKTFVC